jgi:uncharacterized protein YbjQ (UPF0145 family)
MNDIPGYAIARGANGVLALHLTSTDVDSSVSEVVAYETAVLVTKAVPAPVPVLSEYAPT